MNKRIPAYLRDKNQITGTIIFAVLFAIVYLNIYSPMSSTTWFELSGSVYFFFTLGFITLATGIIIISRVIMINTRHSFNFTYLKYISWILLEVLLITLFYTLVTYYAIEKSSLPFFDLFIKAIKVVSVILFIPYGIAWLYAYLNSRNKVLRLIRYKEAVSDEDHPKDMELIHLTDNNGSLKLSIKLDNLYYIESQDNYIKVFYFSNGELKNYMLRCKLKTVEESFAGSSLIRCHRSYIINSKKIRVIRKEKDGTFIDMDFDGINSIPVSKGYAQQIKNCF